MDKKKCDEMKQSQEILVLKNMVDHEKKETDMEV